MGNTVRMARTDSDTWSITEGVGPTALGVAMARAGESSAACPLFDDPFAQVFIDAAVARGWEKPTGAMAERIRALSGYAASRTKWFDEFFIAAGAHGVEQSVILGAGLDSRAWRMPWVSGSVVFEIDQPQVLEFKLDVLRAHGADPNARYVPVPVDLRQDWPKALRDAGFDITQPAAWSARGAAALPPRRGPGPVVRTDHRDGRTEQPHRGRGVRRGTHRRRGMADRAGLGRSLRSTPAG